MTTNRSIKIHGVRSGQPFIGMTVNPNEATLTPGMLQWLTGRVSRAGTSLRPGPGVRPLGPGVSYEHRDGQVLDLLGLPENKQITGYTVWFVNTGPDNEPVIVVVHHGETDTQGQPHFAPNEIALIRSWNPPSGTLPYNNHFPLLDRNEDFTINLFGESFIRNSKYISGVPHQPPGQGTGYFIIAADNNNLKCVEEIATAPFFKLRNYGVAPPMEPPAERYTVQCLKGTTLDPVDPDADPVVYQWVYRRHGLGNQVAIRYKGFAAFSLNPDYLIEFQTPFRQGTPKLELDLGDPVGTLGPRVNSASRLAFVVTCAGYPIANDQSVKLVVKGTSIDEALENTVDDDTEEIVITGGGSFLMRHDDKRDEDTEISISSVSASVDGQFTITCSGSIKDVQVGDALRLNLPGHPYDNGYLRVASKGTSTITVWGAFSTALTASGTITHLINQQPFVAITSLAIVGNDLDVIFDKPMGFGKLVDGNLYDMAVVCGIYDEQTPVTCNVNRLISSVISPTNIRIASIVIPHDWVLPDPPTPPASARISWSMPHLYSQWRSVYVTQKRWRQKDAGTPVELSISGGVVNSLLVYRAAEKWNADDVIDQIQGAYGYQVTTGGVATRSGHSFLLGTDEFPTTVPVGHNMRMRGFTPPIDSTTVTDIILCVRKFGTDITAAGDGRSTSVAFYSSTLFPVANREYTFDLETKWVTNSGFRMHDVPIDRVVMDTPHTEIALLSMNDTWPGGCRPMGNVIGVFSWNGSLWCWGLQPMVFSNITTDIDSPRNAGFTQFTSEDDIFEGWMIYRTLVFGGKPYVIQRVLKRQADQDGPARIECIGRASESGLSGPGTIVAEYDKLYWSMPVPLYAEQFPVTFEIRLQDSDQIQAMAAILDYALVQGERSTWALRQAPNVVAIVENIIPPSTNIDKVSFDTGSAGPYEIVQSENQLIVYKGTGIAIGQDSTTLRDVTSAQNGRLWGTVFDPRAAKHASVTYDGDEEAIIVAGHRGDYGGDPDNLLSMYLGDENAKFACAIDRPFPAYTAAAVRAPFVAQDRKIFDGCMVIFAEVARVNTNDTNRLCQQPGSYIIVHDTIANTWSAIRIGEGLCLAYEPGNRKYFSYWRVQYPGEEEKVGRPCDVMHYGLRSAVMQYDGKLRIRVGNLLILLSRADNNTWGVDSSYEMFSHEEATGQPDINTILPYYPAVISTLMTPDGRIISIVLQRESEFDIRPAVLALDQDQLHPTPERPGQVEYIDAEFFQNMVPHIEFGPSGEIVLMSSIYDPEPSAAAAGIRRLLVRRLDPKSLKPLHEDWEIRLHKDRSGLNGSLQNRFFDDGLTEIQQFGVSDGSFGSTVFDGTPFDTEWIIRRGILSFTVSKHGELWFLYYGGDDAAMSHKVGLYRFRFPSQGIVGDEGVGQAFVVEPESNVSYITAPASTPDEVLATVVNGRRPQNSYPPLSADNCKAAYLHNEPWNRVSVFVDQRGQAVFDQHKIGFTTDGVQDSVDSGLFLAPFNVTAITYSTSISPGVANGSRYAIKIDHTGNPAPVPVEPGQLIMIVARRQDGAVHRLAGLHRVWKVKDSNVFYITMGGQEPNDIATFDGPVQVYQLDTSANRSVYFHEVQQYSEGENWDFSVLDTRLKKAAEGDDPGWYWFSTYFHGRVIAGITPYVINYHRQETTEFGFYVLTRVDGLTNGSATEYDGYHWVEGTAANQVNLDLLFTGYEGDALHMAGFVNDPFCQAPNQCHANMTQHIALWGYNTR